MTNPAPTSPSHTTPEIRIGGLTLRFLIDGPAAGASVTLFEMEVAPGAKVPVAHSHDAYDETIYGLAGTLTMTLQGQPHEIAPGGSLYVPRGAVHRFDNFSAAPSHSLVIITPGILGSTYFHEIAAILKASAGGPPDHAAIAATMLRHGLTPAPSAMPPAS
ncbi:MAG TPA: cupin domain-containing protein [Acidobacteriaceae bacterium]|jgi:quercetin dioxygenase-like cupin family protein|nr:cupin domain-containing protein [Acidobacteriaceae bacterium]